MIGIQNKTLTKSIYFIGFLLLIINSIIKSYEKNVGSLWSWHEEWWFNHFLSNLYLMLTVIAICLNKDVISEKNRLGGWSKLIDKVWKEFKLSEANKFLQKVYRPVNLFLSILGLSIVLYLINFIISPGDLEEQKNNTEVIIDWFLISGLTIIVLSIFVFKYFIFYKVLK